MRKRSAYMSVAMVVGLLVPAAPSVAATTERAVAPAVSAESVTTMANLQWILWDHSTFSTQQRCLNRAKFLETAYPDIEDTRCVFRRVPNSLKIGWMLEVKRK